MRALAGVGVVASALLGLTGLLLLAFPHRDHHWLNRLEEAMPRLELAFLTPRERETYWESREAIRRNQAELHRWRVLQHEVQRGTRQLPADQQERLHDFLASSDEVTAGDRMVLSTLRRKARGRQRYWLGLPLLGLGGLGVLVLLRSVRLGVGLFHQPRGSRKDRMSPTSK